VEFTKIIGRLTEPVANGGRADEAFDVVIPSIPGFGFSDKPAAPGYDPARIAVMEAKLMARLGYQKYGAQGGDWGAIINTQLALLDPAHVAGLHINMCGAPAPPGADPNAGLSAELARLKVRQGFQVVETGTSRFRHEASTLGVALNDSPVGLAHGLSKIPHRATAMATETSSPRTSCSPTSLYWVTQSAASSARIYYNRAT
jgi:microsomal epoxide hydrolase